MKVDMTITVDHSGTARLAATVAASDDKTYLPIKHLRTCLVGELPNAVRDLLATVGYSSQLKAKDKP